MIETWRKVVFVGGGEGRVVGLTEELSAGGRN